MDGYLYSNDSNISFNVEKNNFHQINTSTQLNVVISDTYNIEVNYE